MVGDAEEEGAQEWTDVCGPDQVLDEEGGTCIDQPQLVFGGGKFLSSILEGKVLKVGH